MEPSEERMIRWEEILRVHPLLGKFLEGTGYTHPEAWLFELGNYTGQLEDLLNEKVGTDWETKIVAPLHKTCVDKNIFSQKLPIDTKFWITRTLFLLGCELGNTADISLTCYPVVETLRSIGVLNEKISGSLNAQSNDVYHKVIDIMQYGADCKKNPLNVVPWEDTTLPTGNPKRSVPGIFYRAELKLDI